MPHASTTDQYVEWTYPDAQARGCADYVSPSVMTLAGPLGSDTRVLDVGCGNGALAGLFLRRGCRVVGVDLSARGIEIARSAHPQGRFEVASADGELLQTLGEDPFDLVVSTEVIEHLYAPAAFLEGCHDALRPRGRLIISTPYHGWLKNVLIAAAGKADFHYRPLDQGGHIKFWSRKTLTLALEHAGFGRIQFEGTGRMPYLWKSMVMAAERQ
jgi:2-polyprenyl-6-hydroxyphenyl methylase/3-demethylubiquinone-9 3-methyltransferase